MPWKECSVMDERLQFVGRRLAGEPLAELCREFGISRKSGDKIFERDQECGVQGLTDRSRRPYRYAHQLPFQVENYILNLKREHPSWGARQIGERLRRRFSDLKIPAKSTVHAVWIVMVWCNAVVAYGGVRREPLYHSASAPTHCGARITRASACWAIIHTAIRSPSPIMPAVSCWPARRFPPPARSWLLLPSNGCLRNAV
jgi:hypothetical protein